MYTIEDYKWNLNPRFIRIMCIDNTRIHYLNEKEIQRRKTQEIGGENGVPLSDLGIPIFGEIGNNN